MWGKVIVNSGLCILDDVANGTHIVFSKVVVHRQAHKAIGITVTLGQGTSVVFWGIVRTAMETEVMEDCQYTVLFEVLDKGCTLLQIRHYQIEHVGIVGGIQGDVGQRIVER